MHSGFSKFGRFGSRFWQGARKRTAVRRFSTQPNQNMPGWPPGSASKPGYVNWLPWIGLGVFTAVGGGMYYVFKKENENKRQAMQVKSVGTAKIGGPWSLVNHEGKPVTSANLYGTYSLIYFGFTYCPDICPYELNKMTKVVNEIDSSIGPIIQPVLISVDPWRDTVEQLDAYIKDFHPRLVGLTGTPEQVDKITRDYRVFFSKTAEPEQDSDYLVDHSIFMYLMDPEGKFVDYFGVNLDHKQIVEKIRNHLIAENKLPPDTTWNRLKDWFSK